MAEKGEQHVRAEGLVDLKCFIITILSSDFYDIG